MLIVVLVAPIATIAFVAVLLGILHERARRRGGSLLKNLGSRGWVVAIQVVFAAGLFSGILTNALITPYNFPVDWTPVLLEGPILGALGLAVFFMAWREVARTFGDLRTRVPQKG